MRNNLELSFTEIQDFPKIDLHRHLLGSARPKTLWELSRKYKLVDERQQFDEFKKAVVHKKPPLSLSSYIKPWKLLRQVIQSPGDIRQIAKEAAEDARGDGVKYVEFRSSLPGLPITDGNAPQTKILVKEYLHAIREGFSAVSGVKCVLVASVNRHAVGNAHPFLKQKYTEEFLNAVVEFGSGLIVGVDLTGIESGYPAGLFKSFFAEARKIGLPITIHAGETEGPEEIWTAIDELGASRIGHGTSAPKDPMLVKELIKRNVVLEVCPTVGWLIGSLENKYRHPVINCNPPIPYVICTDNPTLNDGTQSSELSLAGQIAKTEIKGFLRSQFQLASRAAFASSTLQINF